MFHLVSLSLQISLTDLPGSCLGLCVCVAFFVVFVGLVVGFFLWGNLISITGSFQLLTDHVSHLSGNAGEKKNIQAIYTELLCASSRHRAVREQEKQRPPTGLVKVVCLPFDGAAAQKHGRRKPTDARFETMLGRSSWVDSLFVWVPASWMPW